MALIFRICLNSMNLKLLKYCAERIPGSVAFSDRIILQIQFQTQIFEKYISVLKHSDAQFAYAEPESEEVQ